MPNMHDLLLVFTVLVGAAFVALVFTMFWYVREPSNWLRPRQMTHRNIHAALDTLDDGILFCQPDGRVLLCSETMRTLSELLCGTEPQNGLEFWKAVGEIKSKEHLKVHEWKGGYLLRFQGGNTWLLRKAETETLLQIAAQNVTELDRTELQVRTRTAERDALTPHCESVRAIRSAAEEEKANLTQSQDTMAGVTQKMAALYRFFTEHYALPAETFDYKKLAGLTAALTEDLTFPDESRSEYELAVTLSALRILGTTVELNGTLPENREVAAVFEQLVREAGINSILHGNATTLIVTITDEDESYRCRVANNGAPLKDVLQPGTGIRRIRKSLFPLNGSLEIHKHPIFTVTAEIPKPRDQQS